MSGNSKYCFDWNWCSDQGNCGCTVTCTGGKNKGKVCIGTCGTKCCSDTKAIYEKEITSMSQCPNFPWCHNNFPLPIPNPTCDIGKNLCCPNCKDTNCANCPNTCRGAKDCKPPGCIKTCTGSIKCGKTTQPEPVKTTPKPIPVTTTAKPIPVKTTTNSIPVTTTKKTDPVTSTTNSIPVTTTRKTEPVTITTPRQPLPSTPPPTPPPTPTQPPTQPPRRNPPPRDAGQNNPTDGCSINITSLLWIVFGSLLIIVLIN